MDKSKEWEKDRETLVDCNVCGQGYKGRDKSRTIRRTKMGTRAGTVE
jgi:hypothetical protein